MKHYKIFQHPDGKIKAVKQGWSWPAFLFCLIWTLIKKMYLTSVALFLFALFLDFLVSHLQLGARGDLMINIISIAVSFIFGLRGNEWWEALLYRKGFEDKLLVEAPNPRMAMAIYQQHQ